jgi:hypothetical protein
MRSGITKLGVVGACLIVGLLLLGCVYLGAQLGAASADEARRIDAAGQPIPSGERRLSGRNPIINALGRLLDSEGDIAEEDRATSWETLVEADDILADMKEQNAEALRDLKRPLHTERHRARRDSGIYVYPPAPQP